ncbi:MAG: tetratricopeptide repeat protein [Deltaproteobacteria bacterium]|nr:tetratricopeptide repeat protein [Deltaproteobacteria bacterium]
MRVRRLIALLSFALIIVFSSLTTADEKSARALFMEGVAAFESGHFAEAAAIFRQAYNENSSWKIQYNIGQCEAAAKHHGRAMEAFEYYLSLGGDDVPETRRAEVEAELDRLRRVVGFVNIQAPDGAQISVDGEARGTAPLTGSLMVAASVDHDIQVTLDESLLLSRRIRLGGTQSITLEVKGARTDKAAEATEPSSLSQPVPGPHAHGEPDTSGQSNPASPYRPIGIALVSAGGAALIAGGITGILAFSKSRDLKDKCPGGVCPIEYHGENTTREHLVTATNVLLISGGTIALTGAVFLIIAHRRKRADAGPASLISPLSPMVSADAFGLIFSRGF